MERKIGLHQIMIDEYKSRLIKEGLVEIDLSSFPETDLLTLASCFGEVIPGARGELIQILSAREKGNGPIGSFSYTVGYDAFPWHTDTAYWPLPARYLMLTSPAASPCATLYQSFEVIKDSIDNFDYLMSRAVYLLDIPGNKRYLSPCIQKSDGKKGFKMDFHIYRPMNDEARYILKAMKQFLDSYYMRLEWTGDNAVIIDNWRFIHSREEATGDKKRILKRIYINELD